MPRKQAAVPMLIGCILSSMALVALGVPNGCSDGKDCTEASKNYLDFLGLEAVFRCYNNCTPSRSENCIEKCFQL
ncbi:hypothetical protein NL676_000254 [Syzygium grande]|nr:hypothetical protein NL676_000254 [Syzygium grande]